MEETQVPRSRIKEVFIPQPEKVVGFNVDAKYLFVVLDSGRVLFGDRSAAGIMWAEGEPVPGTRRAQEITAMRESFAKEAATNGEATDKA